MWASEIRKTIERFRYVQLPSKNFYVSVLLRAVLWLMWLVASLSPRRPGFVPWSVHVVFVVGNMAVGQAFCE
jgi:hypothetical protein